MGVTHPDELDPDELEGLEGRGCFDVVEDEGSFVDVDELGDLDEGDDSSFGEA